MAVFARPLPLKMEWGLNIMPRDNKICNLKCTQFCSQKAQIVKLILRGKISSTFRHHCRTGSAVGLLNL